jgi:hypothetical protein
MGAIRFWGGSIHDEEASLADQGISKSLSSRCQAIAEVPAEEVEGIIAEAMEEDRELTSKEAAVRRRHRA